jgi:hypothetical protein
MHSAFQQGGGDGLDGAALKGGLAREFGLHFGSDIERDGHGSWRVKNGFSHHVSSGAGLSQA